MAVKINGTTGVEYDDDVKHSLGTSNDLEIFHNGSDSIINDAGTGNLKIQTGGNTKLEIVSGGATVTGTCTATTFSGSGASLTALPAANLTGTLPAISATNLTNVPAANITGTLPAIDGSNLTGIVSVPKENLIINGAFQVWQRQTDDTNNLVSGYCGPDRWQKAWYAGTVTGKRLALTSSDTLPWNDGFRYAFQLKCTSTTTNSDRYCQVEQVLEAQDVAKSGWKYTDSNSKVRIQFYARSSLAGTYWCRFTSVDGTGRSFPYSYSLSANTWTKVSFAVPGDSNVTVDNNSDAGFRLNISQYLNTGLTDDASVTSGSWMNWDSDKAAEDYDQDWMGSANATFDITGVQITVGEEEGDFQHRSYGAELALCQRYFQCWHDVVGLIMRVHSSTQALTHVPLKTPMRKDAPTYAIAALNSNFDLLYSGAVLASQNSSGWNFSAGGAREGGFELMMTRGSGTFSDLNTVLHANIQYEMGPSDHHYWASADAEL